MVLNYRYMVLELFYDGEGPVLTHSLLTTAIKDSILHTFGEFGLGSSQSTLHVKYVNPITRLCIIRCGRSEYEKIWCAITFITSINNYPLFFNLLDLSGNVTCCKRVALEYDKAKITLLSSRTGKNQLTAKQLKAANTSLDRISEIGV